MILSRSDIEPIRDSITCLLNVLIDLHITPAQAAPPALDLSELRAAGIPCRSDEDYLKAINRIQIVERRKILDGMVHGAGWEWEQVSNLKRIELKVCS